MAGSKIRGKVRRGCARGCKASRGDKARVQALVLLLHETGAKEGRQHIKEEGMQRGVCSEALPSSLPMQCFSFLLLPSPKR